MSRLVIVGASLAGLRAAQGARAAGHSGPITVVGDEPHLPYNRPPLSKQLLAGEQTAPDVAFPVEKVDVEWRLGVAATALDPDAKLVALADGAQLSYDRLIIATGCRPRDWVGSGAQLDGIHSLRGLEDAARLQAALATRPRLAIIGAGLIGSEVAATARKLGCDVSLIDIAPLPMVPLGAELSGRCAELHRRNGVELHLGTGVRELTGEQRVDGVVLQDGTQIPADAVLVALGGVPNTDWLDGSGVSRDARGGVLCDATLATVGDPDVAAAGDIASWPHPLAGGERVRVEHWTVAAEHGTLAGRNVVAGPAERAAHTAPPYFWSDQYNVKIQGVGFPGRAETLTIVADEGDRLIAEAHDAGGRLIGAVTFGHAKALSTYRRRLAAEVVAA